MKQEFFNLINLAVSEIVTAMKAKHLRVFHVDEYYYESIVKDNSDYLYIEKININKDGDICIKSNSPEYIEGLSNPDMDNQSELISILYDIYIKIMEL